MAQARGCFMKICRPSRQLSCVLRKSSNPQFHTFIVGGESSAQDKIIFRKQPFSYVHYRQYCVRLFGEAEHVNRDDSLDVKKEKEDITAGVAKDIAQHAMGENILNPDFFDYLLSVQTLKKQNGKQRQRILSVCFQRLAEFVTEITDEKEKEEYVTELFQKSSFKETSQFISNELDHFSFRFLTSILGSLVQMTSKDIFLIECIGNELLIRLEQKPDPKLAKMVPSFLQNNHKAGIPQMLFDKAMKILDKAENVGSVSSLLHQTSTWQEDHNSKLIQELQGKLLQNAHQITIADVQATLCLLGAKKIRNSPLIKAMVNRLQQTPLYFSSKQLKDLFYACSSLSVNDQTVLKNLSKNLLQVMSSTAEAKSLYPILISCSRLGWKHYDVITALTNEVIKLFSQNLLEKNKLVSVIVSLGHLNWDGDIESLDTMMGALEKLQKDLPLKWLDVVWSLAVLKRATMDMVHGVLTDDFCQSLEMLVGDKPVHIQIDVLSKLLNLAGYAVLDLNAPQPPVGYKIWKKNFNKKIGFDTSCKFRSHFMSAEFAHSMLRKDFTNTNIMVEPVGKVLKSVAPATALSTNRELDYGHIADFDLHDVQLPDGQRGTHNLNRVVVKVLKFSDMLRTEGHPEPDGRTAMCIRHLKLMGYHVVTVPYDEWGRQFDSSMKENYLKDKLQASVLV